MAERFIKELFTPNLQLASTRWPKDFDKDIYAQTFSKEWNFTEIALGELGIEFDTPPSDIPGIDQILHLNPFTDTEVFEITGMPGAGKSSLSAEIVRRSEGNAVLMPEPYSITRQLGHIQEGDYLGYVFSSVMMTDQLLEMTLRLASLNIDKEAKRILTERIAKSKSPADIWDLHEEIFEINASTDQKGVVVADRLYDARVWARSLFLTGLISLEKFIKLNEINTDSIKALLPSITGLKPPESILVMLTTPNDSLQNKSHTGRLMNVEFLRVLYTQYLRRFWELKVNEFPNLVLFDATCSQEEALKKISNIYSEITGYRVTLNQ